ncbi:hypothetical protein HNY73_021491 [Argiope bruennichi]|uniref:Uncharacterized protein n=1 Tax=Argiope bruennichi TaxID=94029 RepID=A0A8T0E030_ARGBR|nr:hypothetical protein HNY73_021491 [Argiope bruennichi]
MLLEANHLQRLIGELHAEFTLFCLHSGLRNTMRELLCVLGTGVKLDETYFQLLNICINAMEFVVNWLFRETKPETECPLRIPKRQKNWFLIVKSVHVKVIQQTLIMTLLFLYPLLDYVNSKKAEMLPSKE